MDPIEENDLANLKKTFIRHKKAFEKWNTLIIKREELESQIAILTEKDSNLFKKEEHEKLKLLKNKLRDLDHTLDHLEEHSIEKITELKKQLVLQILENQSEKKKEFESLQGAIFLNQEKLNHVETIYGNLKQIDLLFNEVMQARERIKRLNILSYIFGGNPNVQISQHLSAIHDQIEILNPFIKEEELALFLKEVQQECKQRWGFKKIDQYFYNTHQKLKKYLHVEYQEKSKLEEKLQALEKKEDDWLVT
jgi:hypothetical protein